MAVVRPEPKLLETHMLALTLNGTTEFLDENDHQDAMRRYWQAKQAGDTTATLVRVASDTAAGQVSQLAVERVRHHEQALTAAGFELESPLYAPGTRVLPLGDQRFHAERRRVEDLPAFVDAADRVCDTIRQEDREDVAIPLRAINMRPDGKLDLDGYVLGLERGAFRQLAQLAGFGTGASYLADHCDPELRAQNVNRQLATQGDRRVVFRTRRRRGVQRHVYATVTPTYTPVDADEVLREVTPALGEAHAELLYDGTSVRGTALWMPNEIVDLAAGDVFKAGVRVETDDAGRGRIRLSGAVWRNRCLNLIIVSESQVETLAQVHRGDREMILDRVSQSVDAARASVAMLLEAWGHARTVRVDVEALLREWVDERTVAVPGTRSAADREATYEHFLDAWRQEPGDTLADAVNAVTRAAHENPLWDIGVREELERQASRLVLAAA